MAVKPLDFGKAKVKTAVPSAFAAPAADANLTAPAAAPTGRNVPRPRIEDLMSLDQIDNLGIKAGTRTAGISQRMLEATKLSEADAFGDKLNEVVAVAKGLDPKSMQETKGFLARIFKRASSVKEQLLAQHSSVAARLNTLDSEVEAHQNRQREEIKGLGQLRIDNHNAHKEFGADIEVGVKALQILQDAVDAGPDGNDAFAAQQFADIQRRYARLEKKLDDMRRAQILCIQLDPQIALEEENKSSLISMLHTARTVMIPALTNQFVLYVNQLSTAKTAAVGTSMYDMTDAAIRGQADQLRANVQAVGQLSQRSVVSLETFQHTQTQLFATFDDMANILQEGRKRRNDEAPKLQALEKEMIDKFTKVVK